MPSPELRPLSAIVYRPSVELAMSGVMHNCRIHLQTIDGLNVQVRTLSELVTRLHERQDPSHAFVESAAALGIAMHCVLNHQRGINVALEEAASLLLGYPVMQILIQLERCANRHASLLTPREVAGCIVFKARRIVRGLYPASQSNHAPLQQTP